MILAYFTRQVLATGNHAVCVTLMMCCLTAINQLVKRKVLTMAKYELKPCPFCGGKAKFVYEMPQGTMVCQKCGVRVAIFSDSYEQGDCKDEAIEAWNQRTENG